MNLSTLIDRSRSKLNNVHPYIAERALELVRRAHAERIYIQITHGYRSIAEQDSLYAQGRTKSGSIVTNARGGYSYHNFGLAVDFVVLDSNGKANWNVDSRWRRVGAIGQSLGLEWGGAWKSLKDYPHFQHTFGLSTAQLRAGRKPPTNYKKLNAATEEDETLELSNYQWGVLEDNVKALLNEKVITDQSWLTKTKNKKLTISELAWLNNVVLQRLRK